LNLRFNPGYGVPADPTALGEVAALLEAVDGHPRKTGYPEYLRRSQQAHCSPSSALIV
jgi:hypothetical protein